MPLSTFYLLSTQKNQASTNMAASTGAFVAHRAFAGTQPSGTQVQLSLYCMRTHKLTANNQVFWLGQFI